MSKIQNSNKENLSHSFTLAEFELLKKLLPTCTPTKMYVHNVREPMAGRNCLGREMKKLGI